MAPTTPTTTRVTRSQSSASILGKRGSASISRQSSISSIKSSLSVLTPDPTPNPKRVRTATMDVDDHSNKENIPPVPEAPSEISVPNRLTRRATIDSFSTPRRNSRTPRRLSSTTSIPETPTTSLSQLNLSISTPPPTPLAPVTLDVQIRALLRSLSNSNASMSMSGREKEREIIENFLRGIDQNIHIEENILYISGSPGTGKTALVNNILASSLFENDIKVIFINCMTCSSVDALWDRLREDFPVSQKKTKGKKVSTKEAVTKAIQELENDCVIILDEIDHFISSSVALQPLFGLAVSSSKAVRVIGIANTHTVTSADLLPPVFSTLSCKVKTIHFAPYTPPQLLAIVQTRLESLPKEARNRALPAPALTLLAKKIAALTGDVRTLFEVLRNAIDLATAAAANVAFADAGAASFSLTPSHILVALKSYTPSSNTASSSISKEFAQVPSSANSETIDKIRNLGIQARLVLLSLLLISKRLWSNLPLPSLTSTFAFTSSPNKRASIKRTSLVTYNELGSSNAQGIDATQLHSYYCTLLQTADTITPVSRSEFTDIIGILETNGLIAISSTSRSSNVSGTRTIKRSTSFAGKLKAAAAGSTSSMQEISLLPDIRETEICRGMGISQVSPAVTATAQTQANQIGDVLEEEVRAIWEKEKSKIMKELKAKAKESLHQETAGFGFENIMDG